MHYKDGTKAQLGDVIKFEEAITIGTPAITSKVTHIGVLNSATPGSDSCNGYMQRSMKITETEGCGRVVTVEIGSSYVTIGKCDKIG